MSNVFNLDKKTLKNFFKDTLNEEAWSKIFNFLCIFKAFSSSVGRIFGRQGTQLK